METGFRYLTVIILLSLLSMATVIKAQSPADEGQSAPDFEIIQVDGSIFKLSEYKGKQAVYLVFWNTWCGYCIKKIPKLKDAQSKLSEHIRIIAINTGLKDSVDKTLDFQQQFDINYSLAFDHGKKITDLYGVWGTPTEFIIDINGIIQHRDKVPDQLQPLLSRWNTLTQILSNKDGCSRKRSTC
ncbi:MAG: TlpA family protein disulfide reductase [Gammaproteobacteria bacterium]|nr:MAG: TlpA family protein disulfide reductase [Gammaproteobacteria bacterium]